MLLGDVGGADADVLVAGDRMSLLERALDPVGDDRSGGAGTDVLVGRVVGEAEEGTAQRVAAPALGGVERGLSNSDDYVVKPPHCSLSSHAKRAWRL